MSGSLFLVPSLGFFSFSLYVLSDSNVLVLFYLTVFFFFLKKGLNPVLIEMLGLLHVIWR